MLHRRAAIALLIAATAVPLGLPSPAGAAQAVHAVASATQAAPAAGAAPSEAGGGWEAFADGTIVPFGGAPALGDLAGTALAQPIVGIAATPTGAGYWMVASDGGVFSFGDARFHGSTGAIRLNRPVVGMAATPTGNGYWLVASDGGIFTFGDARFFGSTGAIRLNQPVVGMAATPTGNGYWLVASDGGIFTFGDARFHGSTGDVRLVKPVVGMAPSATGNGYWLVASDGGLFSFGDSRFAGSLSASGAQISGMAAAPGGVGYYLVTTAGSVVPFGIPSATIASSSPTSTSLLTAALAGHTKLFGISPNGNSKGIPTVPTLAAEVGHPVQIVNIFMGWNQPLPVTSLQAIAAQGAIPELTWEQWPAGGGPNQPAYADAVITSGRYDTYIRSVATAAKAWNGPILVRYGHEMNGNWYPWAASVNGNTPAAFVAAWQHVHNIFTSAGVTNVKWVWCPNAGGPTPVAQVYPGDGYVDIVGMDGYNFSGTSMPSSVFSSLLSQVQAVAPAKPVLINETGTNEVYGNKGPWLQSLFEYVAAQPRIVGVVYSDFGNWILDSSAQAIAGAAAGLKDL